MPTEGDMSQTAVDVVLGKLKATEEEAVESAATECIREIMFRGNLVIDDINYGALGDALFEVRCSGLKASYNDGLAVRVSLERDGLLREKKSMLAQIARLCTAFTGVLPIRVNEPPSTPSLATTGKLEYTGKRPPESPQELLACIILRKLGSEYTKIKTGYRMDDLD
jgi:hypothetical protein